jgi:hypothetical protein
MFQMQPAAVQMAAQIAPCAASPAATTWPRARRGRPGPTTPAWELRRVPGRLLYAASTCARCGSGVSPPGRACSSPAGAVRTAGAPAGEQRFAPRVAGRVTGAGLAHLLQPEHNYGRRKPRGERDPGSGVLPSSFGTGQATWAAQPSMHATISSMSGALTWRGGGPWVGRSGGVKGGSE